MDEQEPTPQDEQAPEPEPAGEEAQAPPSPPPGAPGPPPGAAPKMELGAYLSKAFDAVKADPVLLILGFAVVGLIIGASGITIIGPLIISGPLMFGYLRVVQKRLKGEPAEFGEIFGGFQDFTKALVTGLLYGVIQFGVVAVVGMIPILGTLLSPLAQIAVGAALYFMLPIAALSDTQPVDALKNSFSFMKANLWPMVLLAFVMGLIGAAGFIACCVGVFVTMAITTTASVVAYNDYYLPNAPKAE